MAQGNGQLREYLRQQGTTTPTGAAVEVALRPSSLAHRASIGAATAGAAMAAQRQEPDFKALLDSWGASACGVLMCAGWPPDPDFTEEKLLELLPRLWQEAVDNGFRPRLPASVDDLTKGLQFTFARYDKKKEKQQSGQQKQPPAPQQQQRLQQQQQPAPQQQRRQQQLIQQQQLARQRQLAQQQQAAALRPTMRPTMQPVAQALPRSAGQGAVHPAVIAHQHNAAIPSAPVGSASLSAWLQGSEAPPVLMTGPARVPLVRGQPVTVAASSNAGAAMHSMQRNAEAGSLLGYSGTAVPATATASGGVLGHHPSQQQQQQLRAQPQLASAPTVALQRQQSVTSSGQRQPSGGSAPASAAAERCSVLFLQALSESATPANPELVRALVSVLELYSQQPQAVGRWKMTNAQLCQAAVSLCTMFRQEEQQPLASCTPNMLMECLAQLVRLQLDVDGRVGTIKQRLARIAAGERPVPAHQGGSVQQQAPDAGTARDTGASGQPMLPGHALGEVPSKQSEGEQGAELRTVQASKLEVELLLLYRKRPKLMADFERFLDGAVNGAHASTEAAATATAAAGGPDSGIAIQAAQPQPKVAGGAAGGKSTAGEQLLQESEPGEEGRPIVKRPLGRAGERQHRKQLCQHMQEAMAQLAQQLAGES